MEQAFEVYKKPKHLGVFPLIPPCWVDFILFWWSTLAHWLLANFRWSATKCQSSTILAVSSQKREVGALPWQGLGWPWISVNNLIITSRGSLNIASELSSTLAILVAFYLPCAGLLTKSYFRAASSFLHVPFFILFYFFSLFSRLLHFIATFVT